MMRQIVISIAAALAIFVGATEAPAPTTKDHREIIADTSEGGSTSGASFQLAVVTDFDTQELTETFFKAAEPARPKERARILYVITDGQSGTAAEISIDFLGVIRRTRRNLSTVLSVVESRFDPPPSEGRARRVRRPDTRFRRKWQEPTLDASGRRVIRHKARLEVRGRAFGPHRITQTVLQADAHQVVLALAVEDAGSGAPVASGTISFDANVSTSGGYTCGPIIIEDDDD